jgi:uncharacterized phage-associated protein
MGFRFAFDERKATQAAALLIEKSGGSINYMKLIKLLYLTNREALSRWGKPVVPDGYYSLPYGPILSKVLSLINEQLRPGTVSFWNQHISPPQDYGVRIRQNPGSDEFSAREISLFGEVFEKFGKMSEWDLVDWCHKNLQEWKDPEGSCMEIEPSDILAATGWNDEDIRAQLDEEGAYQAERKIVQQA